jgi:N-acetyl-anhydromuramyl-L-alanine amidase AmpD
MIIEQVENFDKYIHQESFKNQIVLSQALIGDDIQDIIQKYREKDLPVSPSYIIDRDGTVYSMYPDKFWSDHLMDTNIVMNKYSLIPRNCSKSSIGIAFVTCGAMSEGRKFTFICKDNGKEFTGKVSNISTYRGFRFFESYTKDQINSLQELLSLLRLEYNIEIRYKDAIWDVSIEALTGIAGFYLQNSFNHEFTGLYPDTKLIRMLRNL